MPIHFAILPKESEEKGALALAFFENEVFQKRLTEAEALRIAGPKEKQAIQELSKASITQNSKEKPDYLLISASKTFVCLKTIAALGRLYFNKIKLVPDFFSEVNLFFHVEEKEGKYFILPFYGKEEGLQPLLECDFIFPGNPNWFIKGMLLKTFNPDLESKWVKQVKKGELYLENKEELKNLIDEVYEDEGFAPKVRLNFNEEEGGEEAFPRLKLKDRFGTEVEITFKAGDKIFSYSEMAKKDKQILIYYEKDLMEAGYEKNRAIEGIFSAGTDKAKNALYFLVECGWQVFDYLDREVLLSSKNDLHLNYEKEGLFLKGALSFKGQEIDLREAYHALKKDDYFIPLSKDKVGLLPKEAYKPLKEAIRIGQDLGSKGIRLEKAQILNEKVLSAFDETGMDSKIKTLKANLSNFGNISETKPGPSFKGSLRHYQQMGLNWLFFLKQYGLGGLLADDMGLGKTVQVIALLSLIKEEGKHLIVVPTSLLFNWQRELEKFLRDISFYCHNGKDRLKELDPDKNEIILTSYALLREDLEFFQNYSYSSLILDEAQNIKNAKTKTASAIFSLRSDFRIAITGTPVENRIEELFSIFQFLMPSFTTEKIKSNLIEESFEGMGSSTRKKFKPFILRRTKDEVAEELPEKIEQTVFLEMEKGEALGYERLFKQEKDFLRELLEGEEKVPTLQIFELILRLRQYACHPLLVSSLLDETQQIKESVKFNRLIEEIQEIRNEGRKVLVFSQFTKVLDLISNALKKEQIVFSRLDGSQNVKEREANIKKFKESPEISPFLISLSAGGVGLNLPEADTVILYEPWWNEAKERQAIDRAHRIGRKNVVLAKRYIYKNTIEEKMMLLKEKKTKISNFILDEDFNGELTRSDWNFLFDL